MQPLYSRCWFTLTRHHLLRHRPFVHHWHCYVVPQPQLAMVSTGCFTGIPTCTSLKTMRQFRRFPLSLSRCSLSTPVQASTQRTLHTTLVEEEVDKFRAMYESWWDVNGEFQALHSLNHLRVALIKDGLVGLNDHYRLATSLPLADVVILDVGCGGGILAEPLARLGATVIGVDAASENVHVAQQHASHDPLLRRRLKYICATAEDLLGTEEATFDAVIASELLEHVSNVDSLVATCCRLVKPGGSLFLTTLNKTWLSYALAVVGAEYITRVVPKGTHDWNKFIPPEDLQSILQANGCHVKLVHGMLFNPVTQRWSWATPKVCNYAVHAIKPAQDHT